MKTLVFLLSATMYLATVCGCGGVTVTDEDGKKVRISTDGSSITAQGDGSDVEISSGDNKISINSQNEDGSTVAQAGEGAEIPAAFPSDVPVLQGSKVVLAVENKTANSDNYTLTLQADAEIDEVISFYHSSFESNGWEIGEQNTLDSSGQKYATLVCNKDNMKCTTAIIGKSGDQVTINLTVEISKE